SVVVNSKLDIGHIIWQTGRFLETTPDDASLKLLKMVKPGLHGELRQAFQRVKRDGTARKEGILVNDDGGLKTITFEIVPMKNVTGGSRYYMVVFEDVVRAALPAAKDKKPEKAEKPNKKVGKAKVSQIEAENFHL